MGCCKANSFQVEEVSFSEFEHHTYRNKSRINDGEFEEISIFSNHGFNGDLMSSKSDQNMRYMLSTLGSTTGFQSGIESAFLASEPISQKFNPDKQA